MLHRHASPFALVAVLGLAAGCADEPTATAPTPRPLEAPTLLAEPPYTPGSSNTVAWAAVAAADAHRVQVAADEAFAAPLADSGWIDGHDWTFDDLPEGRPLHYRVRSRSGPEVVSPWSAAIVSVQDATPPTSFLVDPGSSQTSLRVTLNGGAADAGSGVAVIEVWAAVEDAGFVRVGELADGALTFIANAVGAHAFTTVAVDGVGNSQHPGDAAVFVTEVPEPIVLTDITGRTWDITNAVLAHGLALPFWAQGIGIEAIPPVNDPPLLQRGDPGYPADTEIFVALVMSDAAEVIAARQTQMRSREVLNTELSGEPYAMTY